MKAEYSEDRSYPQRNSAEHEKYVGAQSAGNREVGEQGGADLLDRILSRDNLNRAYKRVRANKGAPGIDGMTNVRKVMENVKVYIRGWLGYFGIASMKTTMQEWDKWLRRRYRSYIWKQWKKPRTRANSLMQLGIPEWQAWAVSNCRKGYWHMAKNGHVQRAISKERLAQAGYYSILDRYESLHLCD